MDPPPDLQELLTTDIRTEIPDSVISKITSFPPWRTVPGLFNVRDISTPSTPNVRPGFIYRSGVPRNVSDEGKSILVNDLGITAIYDLRQAKELEKTPSPVIEGVDTVWLPYERDPAPVDFELFGCGDHGRSGHVKMYLDMLSVLVPTYRRVFEHIRDQPEKPLLFHCTGGKDRTGILAALILRLAGSSNDAITNDYVLTRIGVEPARGALASSLNLNPAEGLDAGPEKVGMLELCSIRASSMAGFLEAIEELHGGVDGYVRTSLGFSDEDVQKICSNLKGN